MITLPWPTTLFVASFSFLKGMRDKVDITYVTPLDGAFTKPRAAKTLHYLLEEKNIKEVTSFNIERVDYENNKIVESSRKDWEEDLTSTQNLK